MTYWVDQSCPDRARWNEAIITEAIRMVTSTYSRNGRAADDPTFQSSFGAVFSAQQDDDHVYRMPGNFWGTPFQIVEYISGSISLLTPASNQVTSNIRVYCDYDPMVSTSDPNARWKLVPDRVGDPTPNRQKTLGVDQEWYDQINYMRRNTRTLGCQSIRPGQTTIMETFNSPIIDLNGYNAPTGLPYYRSVISVSLS